MGIRLQNLGSRVSHATTLPALRRLEDAILMEPIGAADGKAQEVAHRILEDIAQQRSALIEQKVQRLGKHNSLLSQINILQLLHPELPPEVLETKILALARVAP